MIGFSGNSDRILGISSYYPFIHKPRFFDCILEGEDAISMRNENRNPFQAYALMSAILASLVGSILIGIFSGRWLDKVWGTEPLFLIIGLFHRFGGRYLHNARIQFASFIQEIKPTMPEFQTMFARQRKWMFFLLSFYVLGWGFTAYQSIFLGLILGTSLSLFNLWLMARKIDKFGQAVQAGNNKVGSLGSFSRLATGALAVVITLRYPDHFHLISVVIGLMTSYIVIMIDFFIQNYFTN